VKKHSEVYSSLRSTGKFLIIYYPLGMTIDPAYASFTESMLGSLVAGKHADFVVLSQDIMSVPANQILKTKVLATVIDGQPIYGRI
jgi:predicted amidohydrolase YtcJ